MKKFNYWCPNCKKMLPYMTAELIVPCNLMCTDCFSQVWRKGVEEVQENKEVKDDKQ